jgi:hypothetical protein
MPAIIDVRATLGAVLIGCFIAIACVAHTQRSLTGLSCVGPIPDPCPCYADSLEFVFFRHASTFGCTQVIAD